MTVDILTQLNSQQKEAVLYHRGSSIILAGAGSGKTRVLISKVVNLIKNYQVDPKSILMITFTNKAAGEMKARIGVSYSLGYVGTFHSFCARVLRIDGQFAGLKKNFLIYDEEDQIGVVKSVLKKINLGKKYTPSYLLNRISSAKNQLISPEKYLEVFSDYASSDTNMVYQAYQKELKENNALDFDDLINVTIKLFQKNKQVLEKYQDKYRYILVDEFQDTNFVQYLLTKLLGQKYKNVTVVGDFSQSIYSWRGAEIKNLEKFEKDFPNTAVFYLEKNYRSTQSILNFAYSVISKNETHPILSLFTDKKGGEEVVFYEASNEEDEGIYLANLINDLKPGHRLDEMAVLYRTNAQSRAIEEVFLHYGIPYVLIGGTRFYERKEVKDVLSYLRLLVNPVDKLSKERILKLGKTRFEKFKKYYEENKDSVEDKNTEKSIEEVFQATDYLKQYNPDDEEDYSRLENIKELKSVAVAFPSLPQFLEQIALVESEYFEGEKGAKNKNGIRLMTLHQAKGLEFPVVFIVGVEEGILPHSRSFDDIYSLEEERRLFYVGITRAKERLFITYTRQRFIFGSRNYSMKSRFLE
ncbi:MAG: ATP-dependent DNA helicase PcrA [Candidatus Roizmanbacteria bacterium GW2011_GWC2_37_13]|uniref:DNA 3'-5' helicase n=1 Tax=Candidatus Roizmanbacteria bacterium GW2011_GWC2_37_13 TaxID=1618486 RepID=A0A0G0G9E4_9BACT|nr:MAG: ATP-dependent DNA helicase PcrA, DNA helicase II / ATP-dependent DNA helicase PcrA [Candidatus Roizmanbacteria bacterium GW2011_GWC1_37_12]KKQ26592.1 MAG: ATP-dependent DNA helicase PcrA [Candidatus Roizmanbacteria bacterium GW2011_GWC2_37_13]